MMNPNITLFIQMFHFWVAFFILKKLVWQPALVYLEKQEAEQQELESMLVDQRKAIAENEHRREKLWQDARQQFLCNIPIIKYSRVASVADVSAEQENIVDEKQKIVDQVANYIVVKADNV
jgi:hypothetical protein